MSDINDLDNHLTPDELAQKQLLIEQSETEGITAMAQKLSPLRGVVGKSASPLHLKPVETAKRATYATVSDALAGLITKLNDVTDRADELRIRLTGRTGETSSKDRSVPTPGEHTSIFDQLAVEALLLARLVGELDEAVQACQESVK